MKIFHEMIGQIKRWPLNGPLSAIYFTASPTR